MAQQIEAKCTRCQATFLLLGTDPEDLIHCYNEETDSECGGIGVIQGVWGLQGSKEIVDMKFTAVVQMERHGMDHPQCEDPDCEFHHPEVREN